MTCQRILKIFIILLVSSGLALIGCGEPTVDNQGDLNVGEPDAGGDGDGGDGDDDVDDGDTGDNGDNDGAGDPDVELADPPPSCFDEDETKRPDRCSVTEEDLNDFGFGPASVVTELQIADSNCCFDFTGDGEENNSLPGVLDLIPNTDTDEINETIKTSVEDGTITLVLEHDGLTEVAAGAEYDINFLLGEHADDDSGVYIDAVSFEQGAHPAALLPNAKITASGEDYVLSAGPGTMLISIEVMDIELDIAVRNAMIDAFIEPADGEDITQGIILTHGEIGGIILFEDLVKPLNEFGSTCDCLDNPPEIVSITDGDASTAKCVLDATEEQLDECEENGEDFCGDLPTACNILPFAPSVAGDLDTSGDGNNDAFSAGLTFTAAQTIILGIASDDEEEPECTEDTVEEDCDEEQTCEEGVCTDEEEEEVED